MITNKLFAIGIPSYNRSDILNPNLIKYTQDLFPGTWILIVDNGRQNIYSHENITILKQEKNLFVSKSWNLICDTVFLNYPYCFMLNDDVGFRKTEDDIKQLIKDNPQADFFNSFFDWCSFILPKNTYQALGLFDENMSCWFSDNDMSYRFKQINANVLMSNVLNPEEFKRSGTIEKDPMLNMRFELDRQAYIKKHGGGVGSEQY